MAFTISYFDPGYGAGISGVTCVENETYNPINGVAYTKEGGGEVILPFSTNVLGGFHIGTYNATLRFSIYIDSVNAPFQADFNGADSGNLSIATSGFHNVAFSKSAYIRHVIPENYLDSIQHKRQVDIDGNITTTGVPDSAHYNNTTTLAGLAFGHSLRFVFPSEGICYVSNVIVSHVNFDEIRKSVDALSSDSFPVKLPLKNTSGDFISLDDGEYFADTAGQKLLSVVDASDASDVITKFGGRSKVSHLISYGHPGYRVGANITSATGISESDSSIVAHGSCALSTDTDASAAVAWAVDNTRLSDVDGMKIGWQV